MSGMALKRWAVTPTRTLRQSTGHVGHSDDELA
jgi:hypothetical protein